MGQDQKFGVPSQLDQPATQQNSRKGQKWDKMESWPHFGPPQRLTTPKPYGADPIGSRMGQDQKFGVPSQRDQLMTQQDTKKGQKWDKTDSRPHFGPPQQPIDPPKKPYSAILIGSL